MAYYCNALVGMDLKTKLLPMPEFCRLKQLGPELIFGATSATSGRVKLKFLSVVKIFIKHHKPLSNLPDANATVLVHLTFDA